MQFFSRLKKRKELLTFGVLVFLLFALGGALYLSSQSQEIRKRAEEKKELFTHDTPENSPKPEYVPGEILVKLGPSSQSASLGLQVKQAQKSLGVSLDKQAVSFNDIDQQSLLPVIKKVDQKYKIDQVEKVFKGVGDPRSELLKFKQKFSSDLSLGKLKIDEQELLKYDFSKIYKISFSQAASISPIIQELLSDPIVEYAEPNYIFKTSVIVDDPYYLDHYPDIVGNRDPLWNPSYDYLWDMKKIKVAEAWDTTMGSQDIIVAVIDTGVDYNHPELSGKVILGYDYPNSDEDPMDDHGHGTHVAGTIAAKANNGIGVVGVCPNCKILAIKGLNLQGGGSLEDLSAAIVEAADKGARVINASWGGGGAGQAMRDAIRNAKARGVVFVAAAGNDNTSASQQWPAGFPEVVTVASSDQNDRRSSFSNYGDKIDVAAPGGGGREIDGDNRGGANVLSLRAANTDMYGDGKCIVGQNYTRVRGTSMAAPHVAGLAGLLLTLHPTWGTEEVRQDMRLSADDIESAGWDELSGYGRINSQRAIGLNSVNIAKIYSPNSGDILDGNISIKGLAYGLTFSSYVLEYGQGSNPSSWNQIISSSISHSSEDEVLGQFNLGSLANGQYTIRLRVNSNLPSVFPAEDRLSIYKFPIKWHIPESSFPQQTFVMSNPTLVDLDNNGTTKIVVSTNNFMHILSSGGQILKQLNTDYVDYARTTASVANLDQNYPGKEILMRSGGKLRLYKADGNEIVNDFWPKDLPSNEMYPEQADTIADIDGDGELEIMAKSYEYNKTTSSYVDKVNLWNHLGRPYSSSWPKENIFTRRVLAGKLLQESGLQIITVSNFFVDIFSPQGEKLWYFQFAPNEPILSIPLFTLADVNGDGLDEIFIVSWSGVWGQPLTYRAKIYAYSGSGEALSGNWPVVVDNGEIGVSYGELPVVTRLQRGGPYKLVFPTMTGLQVRNIDGTLDWSVDFGEIAPEPTVIDINGDGNMEIAVTTLMNNTVHFLSYDGTPFSQNTPSQIPLGGLWSFINPVFGDIDKDNHLEMVVHSSGAGIYAFDMGPRTWPDLESEDWPMMMQNERHNGVKANICDVNRDLMVDNRDQTFLNNCSGRSALVISDLLECKYADIIHQGEENDGVWNHVISSNDLQKWNELCLNYLIPIPNLTKGWNRVLWNGFQESLLPDNCSYYTNNSSGFWLGKVIRYSVPPVGVIDFPRLHVLCK